MPDIAKIIVTFPQPNISSVVLIGDAAVAAEAASRAAADAALDARVSDLEANPGGPGGSTDLSVTRTSTTVTVASSSGDDAVIPAADGSNAGAMTAAQATKLAGIATAATANSADATLLARGNHTGEQAISTVTGLQTALDGKAPLASPALSGTPTAPTATPGNNTTLLATTAFVKAAIDQAVADVLGGAPGALDTLIELSNALGGDANFATTMTNALAGKQPLNSALTSISNLTPSNDDFLQWKSGAPANRTVAQVKTDLGLAGVNTGDQTITLTGDATGSGTGSFAVTIANDAVTNAKLANMTNGTLKGRFSGGTGDPEDLAPGSTGQRLAIAAGVPAWVDDFYSVGATFDGGGSAMSTGKLKGFFVALHAGTIVGWNVTVDTGTLTFKTWKIATGTAKPTSANSINTSGLSLSTGSHVASSTVSDFTTTTVAAGDIFAFELTAVSGATEGTVQLKIKKF